jgi:hypothetical protein
MRARGSLVTRAIQDMLNALLEDPKNPLRSWINDDRRTNYRLPYRIFNKPPVPGIRDRYHRPVSCKWGRGAIFIDPSRLAIHRFAMLL